MATIYDAQVPKSWIAPNVNADILTYLVSCAANNLTVTYRDVQSKVRYHLANTLDDSKIIITTNVALTSIFDWCMKKEWPPLTCLIARSSGEDKGLPARRFWEMLDQTNYVQDFYSETSLVDAPKEIRELCTRYLQQRCFNYFAGLKVTSAALVTQQGSTVTPDTPAESSDLPITRNWLHNRASQEYGYHQLTDDDKERIAKRFVGETCSFFETFIERVNVKNRVNDANPKRAWLEVLDGYCPLVNQAPINDTTKVLGTILTLPGFNDLSHTVQAEIKTHFGRIHDDIQSDINQFVEAVKRDQSVYCHLGGMSLSDVILYLFAKISVEFNRSL